jgi:hypothetical protein
MNSDFVNFLTTRYRQPLHFIGHCVHSYALFVKLYLLFSENLNYTYFITFIYSYLFIWLEDLA